jgi:hypothetical protein
MAPPERYTERTPIPQLQGGSVQYLIEQYIPLLHQGIQSCNADKSSIREWDKDE